MVKQLIDLGTSPNKGDGDPLRTAFQKINDNFNELYDGQFADPNSLSSNLIPSTNAQYDIGSFTNKWADLHIADFIYLNGNRLEATTDGRLLINGETPTVVQSTVGSVFGDDSTLLVDGINNSFNLDGTVKGNIIPDVDEAYDIGSPTKKFRDLYLSGSTIYLGDTPLSIDNGTLLIDGVAVSGTGGTGDIQGSVFADDSTLLVDAVNASIPYSVLSNAPTIPADISDLTDTQGLLGQGSSTGDITFTNTTISAPNEDEIVIQSKDSNGFATARLSLEPVYSNAQLSAYSAETVETFTLANGDFTTGVWQNNGFGNGVVAFTGAQNIGDFFQNTLMSLTAANVSITINSEPAIIWNGGTSGAGTSTPGFGTNPTVPPSPITITSIVFRYRSQSFVSVNQDSSEIRLKSQNANIRMDADFNVQVFADDMIEIQSGENLTLSSGQDINISTASNDTISISTGDLNITAFDDVNFRGSDSFRLRNTSASAPIRIITDDNNTQRTWAFNPDGNLTLPGNLQSEGDISIEINLADSTRRIWRFGEDGDLRFPDGTTQSTAFTGTGNITFTDTTISAPDGGSMTLQARDSEQLVRSSLVLDRRYGRTRLSSFSADQEQSYNTGDWSTATWTGNSLDFVDAPNIVVFIDTGAYDGAVNKTFSINGGARLPYDGASYGGNNISFSTTVAADPDPTTVTTIEFFYQTRSQIYMDHDDEELLIQARDMDITIDGDDDIFVQAADKIGIEAGGSIDIDSDEQIDIRSYSITDSVRIITDASTGTTIWAFGADGNLTFPDASVQTTAYTGPQTSLDGDVKGSVFADDSTLLVDAVNGNIFGNVEATRLRTTDPNIALGIAAGETNQGVNTIAIGAAAGQANQGTSSIAIGGQAGNTAQGVSAVALGTQAGSTNQGAIAVSLGTQAGATNQGLGAVAVGTQAGIVSQGNYAVALGYLAGANNQPANSIVINASGSGLDGSAAGFYVNPVRNITGTSILQYNATTDEITHSNDINSEEDISIRINLSDSTQRVWRFGEDGDLTFPDGTTQATAFTGNAATVDILNTNGIDTNYSITFVENRDGAEILRADVDLTFNSWSNTLTAGNVTTGVLKIEDGVHEQFQTKADATGVVAHDCSQGHIIYHTSPDDYFTVNLTNLNLASGYATSITVVVEQGATGYGPNALQISGAAQTINWQGGSLPASPTANGVDVCVFSILNNNGTYVVLAQVTGFNEVA